MLQGSFGFLIERAATMDMNLPRALSRTPEVRCAANSLISTLYTLLPQNHTGKLMALMLHM